MTPVLMPAVKAVGIDTVYFGVPFIINNAIGLITPPVGAAAWARPSRRHWPRRVRRVRRR